MLSISAIKDIPVALLTFGVSIIGVLFTVGYFLALDLNYISLFQLSDHLVFALVGAAWVFLLVLAFAPPTILVVLVAKSGLTNRRLILGVISIAALALVVWHVASVHARFDAYYATLRFILIVLYAAVQATIFSSWFNGYRSVAAVVTVSIAAVYTGFYVGSLAARGGDHVETYAKLGDGSYQRVVRASPQYVLSISRGGTLTAVKSSDVSQMITSASVPP